MRLLSVLGRVAVVAVIIAVPYLLLLWVVAVAMIILFLWEEGGSSLLFSFLLFSPFLCVWGFVYIPRGLVCWETR